MTALHNTSCTQEKHQILNFYLQWCSPGTHETGLWRSAALSWTCPLPTPLAAPVWTGKFCLLQQLRLACLVRHHAQPLIDRDWYGWGWLMWCETTGGGCGINAPALWKLMLIGGHWLHWWRHNQTDWETVEQPGS